MIRRTLPVLTTFALVGTAAVVAGAPVTAAAPSSAVQLATTPTPFALSASGYSTRVVGGDVPAGSDRSAFQSIGCTNQAGLHKQNTEADVDLGLLRLSAARTDVSTTKRGNTVSSWGRNRIAKVVLGDANDAAGRVVVEGVSSKSRTWHNGTGFHASTRTSIASIVLDPLVGPDVQLPVPTRGNPLRVPGVALIALGDRDTTVRQNGAQANADALRIKLIPTGTVVYVAHSRAQIMSGLARGIYSGSSYATRASLLDGTVTSGPTPLLIMPCTGTKFERRDIARVNLGNLAIARELNASQRGVVRNGNPTAFERGKVTRANILDGTIVVRGVVGKANVTLDGNRARKNIKGTTIAEVRFNGRLINVSGNDAINLGNVARIEPRMVKRTKYGIEVTALRVTLLKRGAVLNLGHAKVAIRPSGL